MLSKDDITQATDQLRQFDVVLGPACDGGYYLIGIAGPWRPEFETIFQGIPWSTDQVLPLTRRNLVNMNQTVAELEAREDIDTERELLHLLQSQRQKRRLTGSEHDDFFLALDSVLKSSALCDWRNR